MFAETVAAATHSARQSRTSRSNVGGSSNLLGRQCRLKKCESLLELVDCGRVASESQTESVQKWMRGTRDNELLLGVDLTEEASTFISPRSP